MITPDAPFGTFEINGHEIVMPCEGPIRFERGKLTIDNDPFGWYVLDPNADAPEWEFFPSPWVQRTNRLNELRAEIIEFLEAHDRGDLVARIRKDAW